MALLRGTHSFLLQVRTLSFKIIYHGITVIYEYVMGLFLIVHHQVCIICFVALERQKLYQVLSACSF
jgi:hypothetical protein